jgi:branched-chain amino acid transport system substrate-binding protein
MFLCVPLAAYSKDKIVFGVAIALSGPYSIGAGISQIPSYRMWVEDVNARGGIYVKEYNKRLPIELILYDDRSDINTCVKLYQKLMLEDKVDLLLSPWGTGTYLGVAPVTSKYEYPLFGPTVTSETLRRMMDKIPYFFLILNQPREMAAGLVDLLAKIGVKTAGLIYVADGFGIEWTEALTPLLKSKGIDIAVLKSYPLGSQDLSPLIKTVRAANVDAFLGMSFPPDTLLITKQVRELNYNPKLLYLGPGAQYPIYKTYFGSVEAIEGVMAPMGWNSRVPYPGAKEWFDKHVKRWNKEPCLWGSAFTWASLQIYEQAIEKVGSLDRKKLRDCIATETFPTIVGPVKFEKGVNIQYPGMIGQWQKGELQIVAGKEIQAKPVYPKPIWK